MYVISTLTLMMLKWLVDNWDMKWMEDKVRIKILLHTFQYLIAVRYYRNGFYKQGNRPTWLNNLNCTGTESNLLECPRGSVIGYPSYHCSRSDVSVVCPGIDTHNHIIIIIYF